MKIHRFIGDFDLGQNEIHISDSERVRQMHSVLKLKVGERVVLCDGRGSEVEGELLEVHKKGVLVRMGEMVRREVSGKRISLFCALAKKDNFELIVQKATELGVSEIVPIITDRTVKTGVNMDRLYKIAVEASEQSGRVDVPEIHEPIDYQKSLEMLQDFATRILFEIGAQKFSEDDKKDANSIALFVGPEGGWTDKEKEIAQGYGVVERSLVDTTLRVETAAIVAVYECVG